MPARRSDEGDPAWIPVRPVDAACNEHKLEPGPIGCVAYFVDREAGGDERRFELLAFAEVQRRRGGYDRAVWKGYGAVEGHDRTVHSRDLRPRLDDADTGELDALRRLIAAPLFPHPTRGISRFEHQLPTGTQRLVDANQCRHPIVVGEKNLRNVAFHRR